jgi:cytochrome c556
MHVWRDTPEKVQAVVRKIGLEIENLQKMLRTKSPHDET